MSGIGEGDDRRRPGWIARLLGAHPSKTEVAAPLQVPDDARQPSGELALLDAAISGMPDPVVILDYEGRVVAFNPEAVAIAPALRRGETASIALRMPELVEAIRHAINSGKVQRVEFSAR